MRKKDLKELENIYRALNRGVKALNRKDIQVCMKMEITNNCKPNRNQYASELDKEFYLNPISITSGTDICSIQSACISLSKFIEKMLQENFDKQQKRKNNE